MPNKNLEALEGNGVDGLSQAQLFEAARDQYLRLQQLVPRKLQRDAGIVDKIVFCTPDEFFQMHVDDGIEWGMHPDESRELARRVATERAATHFETHDEIAVKEFDATAQALLGGADLQQQTYFRLIGHEAGHSFMTNYYDVAYAEAASLLHLRQDDFRDLVRQQLSKDPHLLLLFLNESQGLVEDQVLEQYRVQAEASGLSPIRYVREKLMANREAFLADDFGYDTEGLDEFLDEQMERLQLDLYGRRVVIRQRETGRVIEEIGLTRYTLVHEAMADTYMLYLTFVDFYDQLVQQEGEVDSSIALRKFRNSSYLREIVSPEELTAPAIVNAAVAFGGFEPLFEALVLAVDARGGAGLLSEKGNKRQKAIKELARVAQVQEVVKAMGSDPDFSVSVLHSVAITLDRKTYLQEAAKGMEQLVDYISRVALSLEPFDFIKAALVMASLPEVRRQFGLDWFVAAAAGVRYAREHFILESGFVPEEEPEILKIFREQLMKANSWSIDHVLGQTESVITQVMSFKGLE